MQAIRSGQPERGLDLHLDWKVNPLDLPVGGKPYARPTPKRKERTMASETVTLAVQGMNCRSCVAHVSEALEDLDGVEKARVDLAEAKVTVT